MAAFEDLEVWKRAVELSAMIFRETQELRDFGFRDQITRAGLSIPSNIAEGLERSSIGDQCRFLDYARASCGEVRTQAIVGAKANILSESVGAEWSDETRQLAAMISGLIRSIQERGRRSAKS